MAAGGISAPLDFVCHWLIPFCLLLSRDLKRNKSKMIWLTCWMIFARCVDMFWLIEPNFKDAAGNLHLAGQHRHSGLHHGAGCVLSLWGAYYLTQLMSASSGQRERSSPGRDAGA